MIAGTPGLPDEFTLPLLPKALDEWFVFVGGLRDAELIYDGAILDGLGVVDADSARRALEGYRFTNERGGWVDAAESGRWDANWIVLDSVNADPIIADISTPEVAVFVALHGEGRWAPTVVSNSVHEFIADLLVSEDVPSPPPEGVAFDSSVWLVGLGPEPMRTLLSLQKWPMFPRMSRGELLRLHERLPMLISDNLTETVARNSAGYALGQGIPVEVRSRRGLSD